MWFWVFIYLVSLLFSVSFFFLEILPLKPTTIIFPETDKFTRSINPWTMHSTITSIGQPLNSNKNVLGIPVILPRTISSPELPSPIAESLEKESLPLVTLHNTTLGSPNTKSSSIKLIEMSYKAKKQTRSQSTLTLPHMELPGELAKVNDNFHNESNVNKIYKRSRSLSPCIPSSRCHCYNCNVSELIFQDLNPTERSNLRSYFDHCCGLPMNIDKRSFNRRRIITRRCSSENFKHNLTHIDFNKDKQQLQNKISSTSSSITRRMSCPEIVKSTESMVNYQHDNFSYQQSNLLSNNYLECISTNVINLNHIKNHFSSLLAIRCCCSGACKHDKHAINTNKSSLPRIQTQRSFSSPDTRPTIIQPDPNCTARRHRHSISGQMSYFKLLGYNVSKKLTGSTNSLFSTAVISGSSSAPNLKDMIPPHASAVAGNLIINFFS